MAAAELLRDYVQLLNSKNYFAVLSRFDIGKLVEDFYGCVLISQGRG